MPTATSPLSPRARHPLAARSHPSANDETTGLSPECSWAQGALLGVALPGIGGALHYYDQVRLARLPGAAVLAASRDALAGEGFTQLREGGEKKENAHYDW